MSQAAAAQVECDVCLFVGGVADGQRRVVEKEAQGVEVKVVKPTGLLDPAPQIESELYGEMQFAAGDFRARVFGTTKGKPGDVLQSLLERYPPPGGEKRKQDLLDSLHDMERLLGMIASGVRLEQAKLIQMRDMINVARSNALQMTG